MIYLQLFWSFMKIGFTSFGGISMVPLINSEMISHGWMNAYEVSDIIAVAEMTPGPNGLNCAIFAGLRAAGALGCLSATLGVLAPTLTITLIAAFAFVRVKDSSVFKKIMTGVRPASVAMIIVTALSMIETSYIVGSSVSLWAVFIGLLDLFLLLRFNMSVITVICLSALMGFFVF